MDSSLLIGILYSVSGGFAVLARTALWLGVGGIGLLRVQDPRTRLWLVGAGTTGALLSLLSLTTAFIQMALFQYAAMDIETTMLIIAVWQGLLSLAGLLPWVLLVAGLWRLTRPAFIGEHAEA